MLNFCAFIQIYVFSTNHHLKNPIISRIALKGIVLQVLSNQIKVTFIIILSFNLEHL